ncbi:MAG TPA: mechanosensitive ion channel family protein [Bacillales bacterium]|nr:mechanosensitive ion channel family protein [Bacillales bacterium]
MWKTFANHVLTIIFIIIGTIIVVKVGKAVLRKVFKGRQGSRLRMSEKRETTFEKLTLNVFSYVIYFVAFLMILDVFVEVKGLIAGAGIVGLAVGFGAQNLVKDIITGFFIIFEDQFSVGDYVQVGTFDGYVEEIGLRTTKIKSWTGELHILPNSSINEVTNFSVNNSVAVVDVSIAYEEDIEKAEAVIQEVMGEMASQFPEIVRPPELLGVQMLGASDIVIRVIAEVLPMEHWHIAREMRKAVKGRFDEQGIEIPYPRLVTYRRDEIQEIEKENAER